MTLLATIEDLAAMRGVDPDPADLKAQIALEQASSLVRGYVDRTFDEVIADEVYLDGTGTDALQLPEPPVTELMSIVTLDHDAEETEVEATDYRLSAEVGLVYLLGSARWELGRLNHVVVYSHGYELPHEGTPGTLPPAIQMVTIQVASRLYGGGGGGGSGVVTSRSIGTWQETFSSSSTDVATSGLTRLEEMALNFYHLPKA
jgi:hypothetical protein